MTFNLSITVYSKHLMWKHFQNDVSETREGERCPGLAQQQLWPTSLRCWTGAVALVALVAAWSAARRQVSSFTGIPIFFKNIKDTNYCSIDMYQSYKRHDHLIPFSWWSPCPGAFCPPSWCRSWTAAGTTHVALLVQGVAWSREPFRAR